MAFRAQPLDTEGTFQKASSGGQGAGVCLCEYVEGGGGDRLNQFQS